MPLATPPALTHDRVESRLTDLEIKASFTEELLETLNQVVVRQQSEIAALMREVRELRERVPEQGDPTQISALSAAARAQQELPPHY